MAQNNIRICTAVYIETVNHYMNEDSDVYGCFIDESKLLTGYTGKTFFLS